MARLVPLARLPARAPPPDETTYPRHRADRVLAAPF